MTGIDRRAVCEALLQLSDGEIQRRLWLSDGSGGSQVSSFAEAVEQLFTDTGIGDSFLRGGTGLGAGGDAALGELSRALRKVDDHHGPLRTIEDPAMTEVRAIACRLLRMLVSGQPDSSA